MRLRFALIVTALLGATTAPAAAQVPAAPGQSPATSLTSIVEAARDDAVSRTFRLLDRNAVWTKVGQLPVDFRTFHTEGLVKVGDAFFVSATEILEATQKNGQATDSLYDFTIDRSVGAGRGWLFKFDGTGHLLGKVQFGVDSVYHPGGIDFDGRYIWVPVAEYRPNSRSDIYRVDPTTLKAELMFSADDHIGGIVHDVKRGTFHGVSWGSRRLYTWHVRGKTASSSWTPNPAFYIDYQDCHQRGVGLMLCGGLTGYATPVGAVALGGIELVDLWTGKPEHQLPVNIFVDEGAGPLPRLSLTNNPFWVEKLEEGKLRMYFMPESDSQADLLIYDVTPWVERAQQ